jgi:hypothetical protein
MGKIGGNGGVYMNRKIAILSLTFLMMIIGGALLVNAFRPTVTTSFATGVTLKYKYIDKDIEETITDPEIIRDLSEILTGRLYTDNPSCGFSQDISITFFNEEKILIIYPALDGCPIMRSGDSNRYFKITEQARTNLDLILEKYGFIFPAI